nr:MAG TPA: hypothetical protein [Caudoviricetes sp.]
MNKREVIQTFESYGQAIYEMPIHPERDYAQLEALYNVLNQLGCTSVKLAKLKDVVNSTLDNQNRLV